MPTQIPALDYVLMGDVERAAWLSAADSETAAAIEWRAFRLEYCPDVLALGPVTIGAA